MEQAPTVRILFRFYSDLLEQEMLETVWALPLDKEKGHYQVDTIPLYIPFIASDDIILAEWDEEEEALAYRETVAASGNSTVWVVVVDDETAIEEIQKQFHDLGCLSETASDRYFALEIKADINYLKIRDKLNELRSAGLIDYAEPNLSEKHQY